MTTLKQFVQANVNSFKAQVNLLDANRGIIITWMKAMPVGTPKGKLSALVKEHAMMEICKAAKMAGAIETPAGFTSAYWFASPGYNCEPRKSGEGYQSINHSLGWFINPKGDTKMSRQIENNLNAAIRNAKSVGLETWCESPDFKVAPPKASKAKKAGSRTGGKQKDKILNSVTESFIVAAQGQTLAQCAKMAKEITAILQKYAA